MSVLLALLLTARVTTDVAPCRMHAIHPSVPSPAAPIRVVNGVAIVDDRGLLLFGAGHRSGPAFVAAIHRWYEKVVAPIAARAPSSSSPPTLSVVIAPTGAHLYLPDPLRRHGAAELASLASIRAALRSEVRFADVAAAMEGHAGEPLYLKGDHHWNGRGAYYAYRAWADANGISALPLSSFALHEVATGSGSLYRMTGASALRAVDRTIEVWLPPVTVTSVQQFIGERQDRAIPGRIFDERLHAYSTFLRGDHPLVVLRGTAATGRTALVVKNSYGNAFAPLLLAHFDAVVVVDYRYVRRPIHDIVARFDVTDVVLVTQSILAHAGAHTARLREVARGTTTAWPTIAVLRAQKTSAAAVAVPPSPSQPRRPSLAVPASPSQPRRPRAPGPRPRLRRDPVIAFARCHRRTTAHRSDTIRGRTGVAANLPGAGDLTASTTSCDLHSESQGAGR